MILKGRVSVQIPTVVKKKFTEKEFLDYLEHNDINSIVFQNKIPSANEKFQLAHSSMARKLNATIKGLYLGSNSKAINSNGSINYSSKRMTISNSQLNNNIHRLISSGEELAVINETAIPDARPPLAPQSQETNEYGIKVFVEKAVLGEGVGFGELGLLTNSLRNAKIIALTELHCAVISKSSYQTILNEEIKRSTPTIKEFLKEVPEFKLLTGIFKRLSTYMIEQKLILGNYLYHEGDPVDGIYLIKEGEFEQNKQILQKCKTKMPYLSKIKETHQMHEEMDDRVKNFETLIKTDIKHKEEQMLKFNKTSLSFASTKLSQSASKLGNQGLISEMKKLTSHCVTPDNSRMTRMMLK